MMAALLEAALRSLLLAAAVWAVLHALRIRNVLAQKRAWATVLVCALIMPAFLPLAARWHLLPAATIAEPESFSRLTTFLNRAAEAALPQISVLRQRALASQDSAIPEPLATATVRHFTPAPPATPISASHSSPQPLPKRNPISFAMLAMWLYFVGAAILLIRLMHGLASTLRLWRAAKPVAHSGAWLLAAGLHLRSSQEVSSPVTIGSSVILPEEYTQWDNEKLRIVLAHERAHILELDFYLQILATLYTALTWFSPLGWWLKHKLSDLSETISDRSGLLEAADQTAYAQILLEFAAAPRPTLIGVAMARQSTISRRIERLLNESAFRQAFAGRRRFRIASLSVPLALFVVVAFVRVQAASQMPWKTIQKNLAYIQDVGEGGTQPAPAKASASAPAAAAPAARVMPATGVALGYSGAPGAPAAPRPAHDASPAASQSESQATFDRTLNFSGILQLTVSTGSGNITLTKGPAGQIHIHGTVRSNHPEGEQQVQAVAANPPIEQNGNVIRIGGHNENVHNISISYEIEAPADTALAAATGSGNIGDTGVGQNAKLETGSGNISASGLQGGFKTGTGSGNITIDSAGEGDAKAETGSGTINIKGVHGALKAETGSGNIVASGTPSSDWKLESGSGGIELSTGSAALTLDASTGSGTITTNTAMTMETSSDKHHVRGKINGGGPDVRVETGSGDIHIH